MASRMKLSEIRSLVISQADMTGSSFPTDASTSDYTTLDAWINSAVSELHDLLVDAYEDYFVKRFQFDLTGAENYLLPDDFYKLRKVYNKDGNKRYRLRRFTMNDMDNYDETLIYETAVSNKALLYRIMGNEIYFLPLPSGTGSATIELWYIPQAVKLVDPDDEIHYSIPIGWEDFIINDVVARLLEKEESDPSTALARKAAIKDRIALAAEERDSGEAHRVSDVYQFDGPYPWLI